MKSVSLGRVLKNKRNDSCMTTEEMAKYIGISRMTYHKLEHDLTKPSVVVIRKLAVALNATPEYIKSLIK